MSRLLINKSGRIETEETWRKVVHDLWATIHSDQDNAHNFPKPADAWERFVKSQRLEVYNENPTASFDGVF